MLASPLRQITADRLRRWHQDHGWTGRPQGAGKFVVVTAPERASRWARGGLPLWIPIAAAVAVGLLALAMLG